MLVDGKVGVSQQCPGCSEVKEHLRLYQEKHGQKVYRND